MDNNGNSRAAAGDKDCSMENEAEKISTLVSIDDSGTPRKAVGARRASFVGLN